MSSTAEVTQPTPDSIRPVPMERQLPFALPKGAALMVAYAPLVSLHLWGLWNREQYQYFPFVIAAFAYLLVTRFRRGERLSWDGEPPIAKTCYLVAWLLLAGATIIQSPWLASVSLNILLAGILVSLSRIRSVTNLFGIWLLLWLLVPLPFDVDSRVIVRLQGFSSRISSDILDMWSVRHLMSGNVLQLPDKQFFVDEACSGIVSVMSVIACGLIWAVWKNRSFLHLVLLIVAGVGWAISLNVARICIITFAHAWYDVDLSSGWQHEAIGLALFCLTFIALISTDKLLEFGLRPIEIAPAPASAASRRNVLITVWNSISMLGDPEKQSEHARATRTIADGPAPQIPQMRFLTLTGFALVGLVSIGPIAIATHSNFQAVEHAQLIERDFMPTQIGDLVLEDFESEHRPGQSELGDYSKTFTYRDRVLDRQYVISFDYPFAGGWHELCVCYKNTGWTLLNRDVILPPEDDEWPIVTGYFQRAGTEYGYLAFSNFNADAIGMAPPTDLIFWKPWRRLRRRLLRTVSEEVFQVQVWTNTESAIDDQTREDVQEILMEVRETFRRYFERR